MSSNSNGFEYAGGEFENDAPYIEEEYKQDGDADAGVDGGDDLNSILAGLIGSGSYDQSGNADTCFSINAAASFAAIAQPEEELLELELRTLTVESLINIVDVVTPIELMQVTILLQLFRTHAADSTIVPSNLQSIPCFVVSSSSSPDGDSSSSSRVTSDWFRSNEKMLMQALSLLSLSLNQENAAATSESSSSSNSSATATIYTLLHRGSKLTTCDMFHSILRDLCELFAWPDVLDLDSLTKQLVQEMGVFVCEQRTKQIETTTNAASASSSSSSSSAPSTADSLSQLRQRFTRATDGDVVTGTTSFVIDSTASSSSSSSTVFTITLPSASQSQLESDHPGRCPGSHGELFANVWTRHFQRCWEAVTEHVDSKIGSSISSSSSTPLTLVDFTRSLTRSSPLALLLSPDSETIERTDEFFTHFMAVAQHVHEANKEMTAAGDKQ